MSGISRWPVFGLRRSMIILLVPLALLLAWLGGELLTRVLAEKSHPMTASPGPAPPPASAAGAKSKTEAPQLVQLLADGVPADVARRLGYRHATARLDQGGAVRDLALPPTVCEAGAIIVFGAASSDGDPARNDVLALRRAGWLARWTRTQLALCPSASPAVVAVSLGQARSGAPRPVQRALRLMAVRVEDLNERGGGADPQKLQRLAEAVFDDLGQFERFEACSLVPLTGGPLPAGIMRVC